MRLARMLLAATLAALPFSATAQNYPDKLVNYYLPFPAGGESDIAARFQQEAFRKKYKLEMVIQYKTGAGGAVAWQQLNSLPNDGYSIMGINLPHIVLQPLEGQVQYKTEDLTPVYWFHYTPDALVVASNSPYKTFQEFVAAAKAKPGELTLAGSGTAGIKTLYVPFKGTGDLTTAVIGGHVSGAMSYSVFAIQQKSKVRMLAIASDKRIPQFPDVPTFKELGYAWVDGAYRGLSVPKSTSPEMRKKVSDMLDGLNKDPELRQKMTDAGFEMIDIPYDSSQDEDGFKLERAPDASPNTPGITWRRPNAWDW